MLRVFYDAETYYSREYSLRRMSPAEYILDDRFKMLGAAVAIEREEPIFLPGNESARFLRSIKQPYCVITHNALFDAVILSYIYNIYPNGLFCTLSMARALLAHELPRGSVVLANVLKHLGLQEKTETILKVEGMHLHDIQARPELFMEWMGYTLNDCIGCREIFFRLKDQFPPQEALVMDRIIRMATQPKLLADRIELSDYYDEVIAEKEKLLSGVKELSGGLKRTTLMSNQQFAALLASYGIDPPQKISPTTGKLTWAFAKTDQGMTDLLESDNFIAQALASARLGVKSTIEETRAKRFYSIADSTYNKLGQALMPIPLKYSGAHTHRLSGNWKLNMQNLSARKNKRLRSCLYAPDGYTILAVDAAQIEARLVAWICRQLDLLEMFRNGEDTYASFASDIYGRTITKADKFERFNGKTCILGLGFQMSDSKLLITLRNGAREAGIEAVYELSQCTQWVYKYRNRFKNIRAEWERLDWLVERMAIGQADSQKIGVCLVDGKTVILPSGLRLYYDNLALGEDNQYWYTFGSQKKVLYGAKLLENIVQALDRQHVIEAAIRTENRARAEALGDDGRFIANIHDENVYVVKNENLDTLKSIALEEMRRPSWWAEGLPLNAEAKVGTNFGELE
jgi:DNA polymerase bacteriophage-type